MTTFYDVPANFLIPALAEQLKSNAAISMPDWADVVKTGSSRERPPTQSDWWQTRAAALLRKIARQGPIGVTALSQEYGGRKNNGPNQTRQVLALAKSFVPLFSNSKTRTRLHQPGRLVEPEGREATQLFNGRIITAAGHKLLNDVAHSVRPQVEEAYPASTSTEWM